MKKLVIIIFSLILFLSVELGAMAKDGVYDDLPKVKIANGVQKNYYDSGKLKMESEVVGSKRHGVTKVYDKSGKVKIQYRFKRVKFVGAFRDEPKRDYGPAGIFLTFKFWAIVLGCGAGLWFFVMKVIFKHRPI